MECGEFSEKRRLNENIKDALEFTSESEIARGANMSPQKFRYKKKNGFWPWEADSVIGAIDSIEIRTVEP